MDGADFIATQIPGMELNVLSALAAQFLFAMLRIGSFLVASPLFGGRFVPLQIRIIASVMLTVPVFMTVQLPPVEVLTTLRAVDMVLNEIAIGLSGGLILSIFFAAAAVAGDRIANTAGLGFAAQFDPASGGQSPVISQLLSLFLLAIFVSEDAHLVALRIILESYTMVPPGSIVSVAQIVNAGVASGGAMFALGVQVMLPVVVVLLMINVVIGVITRSAPQLNIFSFGFPLTLTVAIGMLYLTTPAIAMVLTHVTDTAIDALAGLFGGLRDGGR